MANWYGSARSNYVRVVDEAAFKAAMDALGLEVFDGSEPGVFGIFPSPYSDDGGWPSFIDNYEPAGAVDDEGDEVVEEEHEFDFATDVMPHVAVGEVLVVMSAGAEKLRYISGNAQAFVRRIDGSVEQTQMDLYGIYHQAAREFKIPEASITAAEY